MARIGRPSIYTDELAERICEGLESGDPLPRVLEKIDGPAVSAVYRWLEEKPAFQERYRLARERQAGTLIDRAMEHADMAASKEDAAAAKVRADARFRAAELLAPHKYGRHVHLSGANGGPVETSGKLVVEIRSFAADDAASGGGE